MKVHHIPYGKKLLPLPIILLLVLSVISALSVNMVEVSAVEYPAIYVEPALIIDPTLTPGTNFTVSIKTDYNGTDIWAWGFYLSYNPNVLHGGIRGTDMWTGDGVNKTFDTSVKLLVPDSEVIRVNGTLMTIETEANDTWAGDGVKTTFDTSVKPVVQDSEVVYVNGTLMTRKTEGNDTWYGDGAKITFYTTKKPLVVGEERVYVDEILQIRNIDYTVDYSEGKITLDKATDTWTGDNVITVFNTTRKPVVPDSEKVYVDGKLMNKNADYTIDYGKGEITFTTAPSEGAKIRATYNAPLGPGAEIEATYKYGHYYVDYSEGAIEFYTAPGVGAEVKATYIYEQYDMDYTEGSITFMIAPSAGAKVEVTYFYGGVTNGDLITREKHSPAPFGPGTFNNTLGWLSYTSALFFYINPPIPVTSGPGTLANVTFTVVGIGTSNITLEEPELRGAHEGETYPIIDNTMPDHIGHGYFSNLIFIYVVDPETTVNTTLASGMNYTISIKTNYPGTDVWGYEFTLTYNSSILNGTEVVNGDLIPIDNFTAGNFDNVNGILSLTTNNVSALTSGPGILANVTFTVVGRGYSDLTLGPETRLIGFNATAGDTYPIIDNTMPDRIRNGYFDNAVHDIAVTSVTASPDKVGIGELVSINVTVTNEGSFTENFEVTAYANMTAIKTKTIASLAPGNQTTLTFGWNTTGFTLGNYIIRAHAKFLIDEDPGDNTFKDGTVAILTHDVAVTNVTTSSTSVYQGDSLNIYVEVKNKGGLIETFNVTVYYDDTAIGTQTVIDLAAQNETTLPFIWDTTPVTLGSYTITAEAILAGDDNTTDNTFTDGTVKIVKLPTASFTYLPENPVTDQVVTFDASLSTPNGGTIVSYAWNFGDGNTTTTADPIIIHAYATSGTYNVTLTITDSEGLTDTTADTVTVEEAPEEAPPPGIPWYLFVAAAVAAAFIIAAVAFYFLKIKSPKPT